jgi:hypothetical protein
MGSIHGSQPKRAALFHWTLDIRPSSKVALRIWQVFSRVRRVFKIAPNPHWVSKLMIMVITKILGFDI